MAKITKIDPTGLAIDIGTDNTVTTRTAPPGPPQRTDAMTMGVITVTKDAPITESFTLTATRFCM